MNAHRIGLVLAVLSLAGATGLSAQDAQNRTIEQYKCRDIMREAGANRDVAIAFLHGFLLGQSGGKTFNLDALHRQTEKFVEHCLSNPDGRAIDSMTIARQ
jgi:hypothetical protein